MVYHTSCKNVGTYIAYVSRVWIFLVKKVYHTSLQNVRFHPECAFLFVHLYIKQFLFFLFVLILVYSISYSWQDIFA